MKPDRSSWSLNRDALRGRVAVVAGARRGAGRGIACALGEAGATVVCTGRTTSTSRSEYNRPETIEESAELVTRLGGTGIAIAVDPGRGRRLMYMRDLACCTNGMAFYSTPSDLERFGELAGGMVMSLTNGARQRHRHRCHVKHGAREHVIAGPASRGRVRGTDAMIAQAHTKIAT